MLVPMKPILAVTKVEQVRRAILGMIFDRSLRAGERLLEAKLASELHVSQATVNAALQDLHAQGVVTKLLNRSTNVNRYTQREIDQLFSVRMVLEPAATAAAARNLTLEGKRAVMDQVEQMRWAARTNDLSRFCLADYQFHQEVYRLSGNSFLIQACQAIAAAPFAYILCGLVSALPTDYGSLAEDHAEVVAAMEQSPEAAAALTAERIEGWRLHSAHALEALTEYEIATANAS